MQDNILDDLAELERQRRERERDKIRVMPCEVYSRIVGYYRPVQGWNPGKREEFDQREYVAVTPPP